MQPIMFDYGMMTTFFLISDTLLIDGHLIMTSAVSLQVNWSA